MAPRGPGCLAAGDPNEWDALRSRARHYGQQLALGVHPWWCDTNWPRWVDALPLDHIDAIGEIGLDACRGDRTAQRQATVAQLDLARQHGLPIVVHCVRAHNEMASLLKGVCMPGIMHGWTGSREQLPSFLRAGLHIGIGPVLLRSKKVQRAMMAVPDDRIVFESDQTDEGNTLVDVIETAARLRGTTVEHLTALHHTNIRTLFPRVSS